MPGKARVAQNIRSLSFFRTMLGYPPENTAFYRGMTHNQMHWNCFRMRERSKQVNSHPFIDTVNTENLSRKNVAIALLTNAIKNNQKTQSLEQVCRYLADWTAGGSSTIIDVQYNFYPLLSKLYRNDPEDLYLDLLSKERDCYLLALPAYAGFYTKFPRPLQNEQFIAAEYNQLHYEPGLKDAEGCIADLLEKQKIYEKIFKKSYDFQISPKQCLMSIKEYHKALEEYTPPAGSLMLR